MSGAVALPVFPDGPFEVYRIIEFEGPFRDPEHLIPSATPDAIKNTRTYNDARFFDQGDHKLIMAFHGIVVRTPTSVILIDACLGNDKHRPMVPEWHMRSGPFLNDLKGIGLSVDEITHVLCTHLHADHVGWNTRLLDGRWVPTFPNAKYLFGREEMAFWEQDADANHKSWQDSVQPVLDAGLAEIVDSHHEIEPGVSLLPAFGHSPGHVMVKLETTSQGKTRTAYVIGDVIHHPLQVEHPEWSSQFCWDAKMAGDMRTSILETVADSGHWLVPAHFPTPTAVRVESNQDGFWLED
ncbi:MAG: MBL fold metallo-hydrolase [Rhodospirillaceae bacterium]|nr:MBL fold metallo-hydrolase [Rhodospirillaceae bacterium]MBT5564216.1 MBL fold metallo-hydrolase [Rhodospirillaceae bacterium]MBT6088781.1 MBL fold metallo-hydrolase [Rhodospirillaceae bacterium]